MTAGLIRNRSNRRPTRTLTQERPTPVRLIGAAAAGSALTLTFDQPVSVKGVPQYTTDVVGPKAVSAAAMSPTIVSITFDAPLTTAASVTIPYEDPAIRNAAGGYVAPYDAFALA